MNNPQEFVLYSYPLANQLYQIKADSSQSASTTGINPANIVHLIPAARNVSLHHSPTIRIVENIQIQEPIQLVCGQSVTPVFETTEGESNSSPSVTDVPKSQPKVKQSEQVKAKPPEPPESVEKPLISKKPSSKAKKNFIYECDICDSRFLSPLSLRLHKTGHRIKRDHPERKAFRCRFCGRQFSHLQTLGDHEKIHQTDDRYNCPACNARYSSKSGLRNHLGKHPDCDVSFRERKVALRKQEEDRKQWGCEVCGKKYRHRKTMVEHRSLHFRNEQHRCERCGAMFETTGGWRKHRALKRCEFSKSRFRDAGRDGEGGQETADGEEVFIPEDRKRFLEQVEELEKRKVLKTSNPEHDESNSDGFEHFNDELPDRFSDDSNEEIIEEEPSPAIEIVTVSTKVIPAEEEEAVEEKSIAGDPPDEVEVPLDMVAPELEIKDELPSDEELSEHESRTVELAVEVLEAKNKEARTKKSKTTKKTKSHKCPKCPKTFGRSFILKNHLRTHTGERPFLCDLCPKSFADSGSLKTHKVVHTEEKPFPCPECPARFARKSGLRNHITVHFNLPCDECDQLFPSRKTLMRHKIKHQGLRPFLCEICSKDFTTKADMKAHLRIHSNEKRYCCKICSARFNCPSTLRRHRNVHAPPETRPLCGTCGKAFSSAQALRKHEDIHKELRPFECEICLKRFRVKDHLKVHFRSHSGEKPFGCELCEKRFVTNGDLKVHYRRHTGEKPFVCEECGQAFVVTAGLYRHQQQTGHSNSKVQAIIVPEYTRAT